MHRNQQLHHQQQQQPPLSPQYQQQQHQQQQRQYQRRPSNDGITRNPNSFANAHATANPQGIANANVNANANTSAFFNATPNPSPQPAATLQTNSNSKPPPAMRVQSHGSANAALNSRSRSFGLESVSTMTNKTCDIGNLQSRGSFEAVPTTIQVTNARTMREAKAARNANGASGTFGTSASISASHFFTQSIPTLNENHSMHSNSQSTSSPLKEHQRERENHQRPQQYESPALSTAVNMFSKTASVMYQTTAAAVHAAEHVGDRVGGMRQDFVKMAAPLEDNVVGVGTANNGDGPQGAATFFGTNNGASGGQRNGHGNGNAFSMSGAGKPPVRITSASDMFQNSGNIVGADAHANVPSSFQPSPARSVRSAAEMFGHSASTPIHHKRSASPIPSSIRSSSPAPKGNIAKASSLFGNVPPSSVRAPSPIPGRSASPAPLIRGNASMFFGQSSAKVGEGGGGSNAAGVMVKGSTPARGQNDLSERQVETLVQPNDDTKNSSATAVTVQLTDGIDNANKDSVTQLFGKPLPSEISAAAVQEAVKYASTRNVFEQPLISLEKPSAKISETPPRPQVTSNVKPGIRSTPARKVVNVSEQSPASSDASSFQKPPMSIEQAAFTPTRNEIKEQEKEPAAFNPISTAPKRVTSKSTPIQSKPLPQFSKPRLPSPAPRRPRVSGTEEKKNISFSLPSKKPLTLPHPKRKSSFHENGKSVNSGGSGQSGNSITGGKFRIPPPLQIRASSPNRRRTKKEEVMSPLHSPSSPSKYALDTISDNEIVQAPLLVSQKSIGSEVNTASREVEEHDHVDHNREVDVMSPTPVIPLLPPGWVEVRTQDTGMIYYLNATTRVVKWDRPAPIEVESSLPPSLLKDEDKPTLNGTSNASVTKSAEVDDPIGLNQNREENISVVAQGFITPIISNAAKQAYLLPSTTKVLAIPEITTDEANVSVKSREAQHSIEDDFVHIQNNESATTGILQKEDKAQIDPVTENTGNEAEDITALEKYSIPSSALEGSAQNNCVQISANDVSSPPRTKSFEPAHASTVFPETTEDETQIRMVKVGVDVDDSDVVSQMVNILNTSGSAQASDNHPGNCVAFDDDPIFNNASFDEANDQDNDDLNMSFVSASSNLLDTTVNTLATARSTMGNSTAGMNALPMMSTVNEGIREVPPPQMIDELSGLPYYFNEASGSTQCEKPESTNHSKENNSVGAPDDILQAENTPDAIEAHSIEHEPLNDDTVFEANVTTEELQDRGLEIDVIGTSVSFSLPNGWIEMFDENLGQPFYFNEEESITQWEMPRSTAAEMQDGEQVEENTLPVEEERAEPVNITLREDAKHEGEQPEVTEEASGQSSHSNEHTHITNWEGSVFDLAVDEKDEQACYNQKMKRWVFPGDESQATDEFDESIATGQVADVSDTKQDFKESNICDELNSVANNAGMQPLLPHEVGELPPGWLEMEDESLGQVYYFNEIENITQWEKPDIPQNESTENMDISNNHAGAKRDEHEIRDIMKGNLLDETSALPAGWTEMRDQNSGNVCYFNEGANITQWEKPEEEIEEHYDIVALARTQSLETSLLEPEINQTFEYHVSDVDNHQNTEAAEPLQLNCDAGDSLKSILPAGWAELVDESSGQPYYFNEDDNITQWESPEPIEEVNLSATSTPVYAPVGKSLERVAPVADVQASIEAKEVVAEVDLVSSFAENDDLPVVDTALPAGWVELVDEYSGQSYYFNEDDNITQWESPEPIEEVNLSATPAPVHEPVVKSQSPERVAPVAVVQASIEAKEVVAKVDLVSSFAENDDLPVVETALPAGWVELVDESSGQSYYFNEDDNITQWESPEPIEEVNLSATSTPVYAPVGKSPERVAPVDDVQASIEAKEVVAEVDLVSSFAENDDLPVVETALPAGWVELVDESSGQSYYFNEDDNITQWESPEPIEEVNLIVAPTPMHVAPVDVVQASTEAKEVVAEVDLVSSFAENDDLPVVETALPAGWVELVDESSGQPYYFNEDDNITQWESPVAVRKDDSVVVIDTRSTNPDLTIPVNEVAPVIEGPATNVVPSLPLGWVELIDESSGKAYFFNEKESLTQWNKPMEIPHSKTLKSSIGTSIKASTRNDASTSQDEWVKVDASSIDLSQTAPVASKKRLPVGWDELIDPSSGKTYYFNKEDTITQWERPEYNLSASFTEFRHRPPHAIASFGFGGRLCIMKPQIADSLGLNKASMSPNFRKGPIEIHRLSELLPEQYLPSKSFRSKSTLNGPFVNFSESEVLQHLKQKSGQCKTDNELLWNLVAIAARWKGSLRSADGYSNKNGPEAAIVDLLLRNENIISDDSSMSPIFIGTQTQQESSSCLSEAQQLLLRGKREEAVKCALSGGDHALALLIASICGPNTFHTTAKYFIEKNLKPGTPLHTATGLYANQIQSPEEAEDQATDFWTERSGSLNKTWQYHLATILSNQTRGWKKVVTSLGDELLYAANTSAAHFCYLVCGRPITQHTDPTSRLVLLGCDHRIKNQVALLTDASWEAYLRTEAYEWAKRKGNPNAVITTLQPFKLRYAILLADFGCEEIAKSYLDSIRKCTGLYPGAPDNAGKQRSMHIYSPNFIQALDVFEDRLSISLGVPSKNAVKRMSKLGLSSVLSKIVPKSMAPKLDDSFGDPVFNNASFDDANDQDNDDINMSFVSASSNLLDTTVNTLGTARSTMGNSTADMNAPPMMSTVNEGIQEVPSPQKQEKSKPLPMFMSTPVQNPPTSYSESEVLSSPYIPSLNGDEKSQQLGRKQLQYAAATPIKLSESKQKPSTPASFPLTATPSAMSTPIDRKPKNEAPSSASSWSVRGWITKKLNPDATEADIGGKMEAYYDEKMKRWIFPGEDPQEVAKPLAPPPTTPLSKDSQWESSTPIPASNDPLSMMMAPPSRTTPKADPLSNLMAPPSRSTPSSALRGPPRIPRSHNAPSTSAPSTANPPGAGSGSGPPRFVIFTPKPADETEEEK